MIKERYEKVIDVCHLRRDFQLLPYGENTNIGEKCINLTAVQAEGTYGELLNSELDLIKMTKLENASNEINDDVELLMKENDLLNEFVNSNQEKDEELAESRTQGQITAKT